MDSNQINLIFFANSVRNLHTIYILCLIDFISHFLSFGFAIIDNVSAISLNFDLELLLFAYE